MLLTPEQKTFILAHEREDLRETALRFVRDDMPLLLMQIAGRKMAEKKLPSWYAEDDILYPPHLSLEQSSSERTARYKASLVSETTPPSIEGKNDRYTGLNCAVTSTDQTSMERKNDRYTGLTNSVTATNPTFVKGKTEGKTEETIEWKNDTFADLTGGMGVDFSFLSPHFREAAYIEQNKELCRITEHNFQRLGLTNATVYCESAGSFLKETDPLDFIYLDPSRRDNAGRKLFHIGDCSPDLLEIKPLLLEKSDRAMVKYSPMLDISLAVKSLGCVSAVHVVSVDNECKELLFLLSKTAVDVPQFVAVNLQRSDREEHFSFTTKQEQEAVISFADEPGRYLYEPNASVLKAGAFKSVAEVYQVKKLHINSHLYTSDELIADFPGRIFEVDDFFVPNKKNIKAFFHATKKANITVRNFPMTVSGIRRKTGLADGGNTYLFATTLFDERKVWIICRKEKGYSIK